MQVTFKNKGIYFALALVLVGGLLGACSGGGAQARRGDTDSTTQNIPADTSTTTIHVTTTEMSFSFDTMPAKAGRYTFVIENRGHIEHNFVLQGNGVNAETKKIGPDGSQTLTVDLAPGQYNFECGVLGHNIAGMRGSFTLS